LILVFLKQIYCILKAKVMHLFVAKDIVVGIHWLQDCNINIVIFLT